MKKIKTRKREMRMVVEVEDAILKRIVKQCLPEIVAFEWRRSKHTSVCLQGRVTNLELISTNILNLFLCDPVFLP